MTTSPKRLYRSRTERVISGVLGGIAEYFETDPVLIRLLFLAVTIFTGLVPGILVYLIAVLIVPEQPSSAPVAPSVPVQDDTAAT
jgi:phage shock protein C